MLRSGMRHETAADVWGDGRAHGRALHPPSKGVGVRGAHQRGDDVGLRKNLCGGFNSQSDLQTLSRKNPI